MSTSVLDHTLLLFVSLALLVVSCGEQKSSDYFEGEILYNVTMEDRVSGFSEVQMRDMLGSELTYLISKGRYKSLARGSMEMNQIYLGGDTLYNEVIGTREIMWHNVGHYDDEIVSSRIEKDVEEINGILCSVLTIESTKGTMKYFYNEKYSLNPSHYEKHTNTFWDFCAAKTRSIPIKWITDTKDLYILLTAKEIQSRTIKDEEFNIPDFPRTELK